MSIDFTILCVQSPAAFLKKKARWLVWNAAKKSGAFGRMSLSLHPFDEATDELPDPSFADRVVAVLHASGRLTADTYDDFDDWTTALAEATQGAIYSHSTDKFSYVWADLEEEQTRARASELLASGDYEELARWTASLAAARSASRPDPDPIEAQLAWIDELAEPALEPLIAAGDARPAPLIVALHNAISDSNDRERLDALVLAATRLPALAADEALQAIAAQFEAERLRAVAETLPLPVDLGALNLLIDGVLRNDPLSLLCFARFAGVQLDYMARRQELVVELARSGRALPDDLSRQLVELVYYIDALRSESARAAFAEHGPMARAISDAQAARERSAAREAAALASNVASARAQNNAMYGINRDRPHTPADVLVLVRSGSLVAAVDKYRTLLPERADEAEQAVEDARAYYASS